MVIHSSISISQVISSHYLREIASSFTPNYPLRFLKRSQNGQLCTAQYCLLIRTSNLASAYFHSHVSSPEAFCSQAIVCHFPMINAVITQTGLIYEEIYMPAEACVSSSAWEMEWELPPAQPEELVFAQLGWRLLAAKGDFFLQLVGVLLKHNYWWTEASTTCSPGSCSPAER